MRKVLVVNMLSRISSSRDYLLLKDKGEKCVASQGPVVRSPFSVNGGQVKIK